MESMPMNETSLRSTLIVSLVRVSREGELEMVEGTGGGYGEDREWRFSQLVGCKMQLSCLFQM